MIYTARMANLKSSSLCRLPSWNHHPLTVWLRQEAGAQLLCTKRRGAAQVRGRLEGINCRGVRDGADTHRVWVSVWRLNGSPWFVLYESQWILRSDGRQMSFNASGLTFSFCFLWCTAAQTDCRRELGGENRPASLKAAGHLNGHIFLGICKKKKILLTTKHCCYTHWKTWVSRTWLLPVVIKEIIPAGTWWNWLTLQREGGREGLQPQEERGTAYGDRQGPHFVQMHINDCRTVCWDTLMKLELFSQVLYCCLFKMWKSSRYLQINNTFFLL